MNYEKKLIKLCNEFVTPQFILFADELVEMITNDSNVLEEVLLATPKDLLEVVLKRIESREEKKVRGD